MHSNFLVQQPYYMSARFALLSGHTCATQHADTDGHSRQSVMFCQVSYVGQLAVKTLLIATVNPASVYVKLHGLRKFCCCRICFMSTWVTWDLHLLPAGRALTTSEI